MGEKSKIEKPKKEEGKGEELKEISAAEKGELPPIFMIYRDNNLFKKWVPKVAETLKGLGRKVKIQSFPAGTPEEEIEEWGRENESKLKSKDILSDKTVAQACQLYFRDYYQDVLFSKLDTLDSLQEKAVQKVILGSEIKKIEKQEEKMGEKSKQAFIKMVSLALKKKKNQPRKVYILTSHISDHVGKINKEKEGLKNLTGSGPEIGKMFKMWLVEAGIPEESIEPKPYLEDIQEDVEKENNWILYDRHYGDSFNERERRKVYKVKSAKKLELPLINLFWSMQEIGFLEVDPKKVEEEGEKILKERFDKKPEESEEK